MVVEALPLPLAASLYAAVALVTVKAEAPAKETTGRHLLLVPKQVLEEPAFRNLLDRYPPLIHTKLLV